MSSEVRSCTCVHAYQDKEYGSKQRVHNKSTKGFRCTVCGNEKIVSSGTKK